MTIHQDKIDLATLSLEQLLEGMRKAATIDEQASFQAEYVRRVSQEAAESALRTYFGEQRLLTEADGKVYSCFVCVGCGAVVPEDKMQQHSKWHWELNQVREDVSAPDGDYLRGRR